MKVVKGLVIVAGILILGGAALDGGNEPHAVLARRLWKASETEEMHRTFALYEVVREGLKNAARMEGRILTLPELCASPYMPVRCSALVNPYTGKPYEWLPGRPGEVSLVSEGDDFALRTDYVDGTGKPKSWSVRLSAIFGWQLALEAAPSQAEEVAKSWGAFVRGAAGAASPVAEQMKRRAQSFATVDAQGRRVSDLSPRDRAAYFVGKHLWREVALWLSLIIDQGEQWSRQLLIDTASLKEKARFPLTHPREVRELILTLDPSDRILSMYPLAFLEVFRNDFTGGMAEKVNAPSPGNYRFEVRADGTGCLVVYGSDHRPVFAGHLGLTQGELRVDAEGKKKWVECPGFEDWLQ